VLLHCYVVNLRIRLQTVACRIIYGLHTNLGIRCSSFLQFNSPFDHAKETFIIATRLYAQFSDVTSPHVLSVGIKYSTRFLGRDFLFWTTLYILKTTVNSKRQKSQAFHNRFRQHILGCPLERLFNQR